MTTVKTSKKREFFDAAVFDEKMTAMISKLRTQKPGQLVGMVGKKDVILAQRAELQKLVSEGYTVIQIAEAMKKDVFEILPKSITEVLQNKEKKPRITKKSVDASKATNKSTNTKQNTEENKQPTTVAGAPVAGSKATFEIKPDNKDL